MSEPLCKHGLPLWDGDALDCYRHDPEPQDGELGYTGPLEGGRDGMPDYHEAPGQVTLYELLEERDPPIDRAEELGLLEDECPGHARLGHKSLTGHRYIQDGREGRDGQIEAAPWLVCAWCERREVLPS